MSENALLNGLKARGMKRVDLARVIEVDKATITKWAHGRVPAERVLEVERVTGIPRHDLRPDLWSEPVPSGCSPEHAS